MVTVAELQALRQARLDLLTGKRVVSVQKDGRRIEYTAASLDELNRAINDAESVLGTEMQGEIVALVHSHPGGLPWLSEADRRLQIKSALSWWLVCRGEIHKFRCVPHLTGRRFEHGVTDCYTLFRDAYHLAGIDMPDFEREDDWWRNGQNLYLDNMEATGFYRISLPSAQPGDILLCCFGASVANHAAIYCGNGELLHHLPEQLSKRERYSEKWQRRTHSAWRHRHWHVSAFTGIYNDLAAASACM